MMLTQTRYRASTGLLPLVKVERPNLRRGSFSQLCLETVVSKMGIEINIEYYEKENGVVSKVAEFVVMAKDIPLSETIMATNVLAEKFHEVTKDPNLMIRCFAGNIDGQEIVLSQCPKEVIYIIDSMKQQIRPVLILCKEPINDPTEQRRNSDLEEDISVSSVGRTASNMVQEMLDLDTSQNSSSPPSSDSLFSPTTSPRSSDATGRESLSSEKSKFLRHAYSATDQAAMRNTRKYNTLSTVCRSKPDFAAEMFLYSDELVSMPEDDCSDTESDLESVTSSSSSILSTSKEFDSASLFSTGDDESLASPPSISESLPSSLPPAMLTSTPQRMKWGSRTLDRESRKLSLDPSATSDLGYHSMQRSTKKKGKSRPPPLVFRTLRKGITSIKTNGKRLTSSGAPATITSPSPFVPLSPSTTPSKKPWTRRKVVKRQSSRRPPTKLVQPAIPESSYSFQIKSVHVVFKGSYNMDVSCREFYTVKELKDTVAQQLNKRDPDRITPWKAGDLILTYESRGRVYELYNDWQFIYKTALYELWVEQQKTVTPVMAQPVAKSTKDDLNIIYRLSLLTGVMLDDRIQSLPGAELANLRKIASPDRKEAQWARRTLHNYVEEVVAKRDAEGYALSMELVSSSTSTILALKIPIDSKIKIVFHYKQCFSLMKHIKVQRSADSVLREIFPCLVACGLVEDGIDEYTMKISGEKSFVAGSKELIAFKDIRRCITKGETVHLSVTEKPDLEDDRPTQINWLPIDPLSTSAPLHTDITSAHAGHHDNDVQALSVWDRDDELTLKDIRAENLPYVSTRNQLQVIVEATLYHGEKTLCPSVTTSAQFLNLTVQWTETLNFKIAKKNIPKSAKILFRITEPTQRRESVSVKKGSKFIYWGLTTLFDHYGMMHNGERVMTLWKGKRDKDDKKDKDSFDSFYSPNPSGPPSNNSDPKAVTLYIKFDCYSFPMYFPSSTSHICQHESTNVAVRRQFQRLLDFLKEGKLHSAVPAYIQKVNWGSLSETLEVYSLLRQIADKKEGFPVEIALKLLDCDFPDENVRNYSTQVLEYIPDEKLEDFLLQLTQALKFELTHDSVLARFLLKRALQNKRIGHFFFWYLKCEMYNPQYSTRFGVIMEAYLKGCGYSMLKQFEDQVEMQTTLEKIGLELKQRCNDDQNKMQAMLSEMLENCGVPEFVLTPVYNPRIQLGNLRPTKCKIMASKKKPQWLEMYNVDPTALSQTPTRLILKMGDDLRQDMITLRMFSLFEKLWEEEGLDLALIPYGCIATGPDTGFIEVVKNARTIAEVSGVNNQTKLLDWIKSHQKNEFGEVDIDKVKMAVKTFVHSCAGYSVATYVLGIGDRHNDNIMVTTSGNLFHIDFGHFLGNIKYCMGFKREWAPFVLTPDFVYVMGGEDSSTFDTYKNLCCRSFLTLRRHADLIINLFSLMRSTGIPELTCVEDTDYIKNALVLEKSEHEAEQMFRKVIKKCLDLKWTVQVMWKFHLLRKKGSS